MGGSWQPLLGLCWLHCGLCWRCVLGSNRKGLDNRLIIDQQGCVSTGHFKDANRCSIAIERCIELLTRGDGDIQRNDDIFGCATLECDPPQNCPGRAGRITLDDQKRLLGNGCLLNREISVDRRLIVDHQCRRLGWPFLGKGDHNQSDNKECHNHCSSQNPYNGHICLLLPNWRCSLRWASGVLGNN